MSTLKISGNDIALRDAVVRHLDWHPEIDASEIGVSVKDGVVTLHGTIDEYATKLLAERAVKGVGGVRAIVNDLAVRLRLDRSDGDIAADAINLLRVRSIFDGVDVVVHNKHVTLNGTVEWLYQRQEAANAVKAVAGILGIFNRIDVKPASSTRDVKRRITSALHHSATLHAHQIGVAVKGTTVTLTGHVASLMEREAAEDAASRAPGVTHVENAIVITPDEPEVEPRPERR